MPHKADKSFFSVKKSWSKKKDQILTYYLKPYLAKVVTLRKPVVLVDGFAGRGYFEDGEPGSPILLCQHAKAQQIRGNDVAIFCIESNSDNFSFLQTALSGFNSVTTKLGRFNDYVDEIVELAALNTVFLYLDPYTVGGIDLASLDRIFEAIDSGSSVEILLNFNAAIFVRCGLRALKLATDNSDEEDETYDELESLGTGEVEKLDRIVGGDWWKSVLFENPNFLTQVHLIASKFMDQLRRRFKEVCMVAVKEKPSHRCPKYYLIFASRHSDALILMNESMASAMHEKMVSMDLFATIELPTLILECVDIPMRRTEAVAKVIRRDFCRFRESEIVTAINALIKEGSLEAETSRTNKNTLIRRASNLIF